MSKKRTMKQYVIYLRKSRTDMEAEQRGEGETLARHEKALLELSKKLRLNIADIYKEVVSGETIASRPKMQRLLSEVEAGIWSGVLVMEIERLARGDTIDQGIVAQAFKFSSTKIITPMKTYDPNNEFDEEFFEFGLFMSRREYKTINRRLQRGREDSIKEGKYVANQPPYGYLRKKLEKEKGYTLVPHPEQANVVKMIYEWYVEGIVENNVKKAVGASIITRKLNEMGIKPQKNDVWSESSVRDILINPVYIGKIRWNWRRGIKTMENGTISKSRPRSEEFLLVDGRHEPIISEEIYDAASEVLKGNKRRPIGENKVIQNPLAGIVVCGKCGRKMIRKKQRSDKYEERIMCSLSACNNVSVSLPLLEDKILIFLEKWLGDYKLQWSSMPKQTTNDNTMILIENAIKKNELDLETLSKQINNTYDLLEQGIYTTELFLERNSVLSEQVEVIKSQNLVLTNKIIEYQESEKAKEIIIPKVENLLNVYRKLETAVAKNDLLNEVLEKVVYTKEKGGRWHNSPDDFEIYLYPKIPKR